MEGIQCCTSACRGATPAARIQFQGESAQISCLTVCEDQSADINIVTAEGDKVTLSSDQHSEATLLTYEHLAYTTSGYEMEEGQLVDFSGERNVSLSVEGELNEAELADIQALLSDLGQMLRAFLTGKGGNSVEEDSADLRRYSSLSAFEAEFEYHASLQALSLEADQLAFKAGSLPQLPEATPAADITAAGADTLEPAALAAEAAVPAPGQQVASAVALESMPKAAAWENDEAAREMAERVNDSGLRPRRFMKLLKKFLRNLMKEMRSNHVIEDQQAKRGETILEKFFEQLEKPSSVSEVKAAKVSLKQQWVSLQYELKAEVAMQPSVEETV